MPVMEPAVACQWMDAPTCVCLVPACNPACACERESAPSFPALSTAHPPLSAVPIPALHHHHLLFPMFSAPPRFYDIWVARDVGGRKFEKGWPAVHHNASRDALEGGWPFQVVCCWDGLVVLNAQPFRCGLAVTFSHTQSPFHTHSLSLSSVPRARAQCAWQGRM